MTRTIRGAAVILSLAVPATAAMAGVVNPDISILGQPLLLVTDEPGSPHRNRPVLDAGETEIVFDAYLNPYAKGLFTLALGEEGLELEEGYFRIVRGLPLGLELKGGKSRVAFGRVNPVHPHALPFAERFGVLAAYLPGEEALNETGVSLERRIPVRGDLSLEAIGGWLQGNTFRIEREPTADPGDPLNNEGDDGAGESRPAFLGRVSGFTMLGEQSALELGVSAVGGTSNVAAKAREKVLGADVKAKLWTSPRANLVLQAEGLRLDREVAAWDPDLGYTTTTVDPAGGYVFANYSFGIRYNVGASFERFQEPDPDKPWTQSIGAFAGYSLLEETTWITADWRRVEPEDGDAVQTLILRVVYSMGPHKPHQF